MSRNEEPSPAKGAGRLSSDRCQSDPGMLGRPLPWPIPSRETQEGPSWGSCFEDNSVLVSFSFSGLHVVLLEGAEQAGVMRQTGSAPCTRLSLPRCAPSPCCHQVPAAMQSSLRGPITSAPSQGDLNGIPRRTHAFCRAPDRRAGTSAGRSLGQHRCHAGPRTFR